MTSITLNLCLTDIPKNFVRKGKNGKFYVNLLLFKKKETDQYGATHAIKISKTPEELQIDDKAIYVGSGTEFEQKVVTAADVAPNELPDCMQGQEENKDLPF